MTRNALRLQTLSPSPSDFEDVSLLTMLRDTSSPLFVLELPYFLYSFMQIRPKTFIHLHNAARSGMQKDPDVCDGTRPTS